MKHFHFESIDSTNRWAKEHVSEWDSSGMTLVTASHQTAGYGQFKRPWLSPAHLNLYASFCFFFPQTRQDRGNIPQLLALACIQTLEKYGFLAQFKWPNDVLLNQKKIAGILCETIMVEPQLLGVVCGIGLNINTPFSILHSLDRPATSLLIESQTIHSISEILEELSTQFSTLLEHFIAKGFLPFHALLQDVFFLKKGEPVAFDDYHTLREGKFVSLTVEGALELQTPEGLKSYFSGEINQKN